jgi:TrpR-related protein YerC/YecD
LFEGDSKPWWEDAFMFTPKIQTSQTDLLIQALLTLSGPEDAYRFLEDVCTIQELKSIAQRLHVACLLRERVTYQEIARRTGASTATISRVNRALLYGAGGYQKVLDDLSAKEKLPITTESAEA